MIHWALLFVAASASLAQPVLEDGKPAASNDCGSVVIVKCDRPVTPGNTRATEQAQQQSRSAELRRPVPLAQQLDGVVIEGDAIRRRSIEEAIGGAFPATRPRDGNYTFDTSEGTKCTCMNVCPPLPFPCCSCSAQMNRYRQTPGSSPLN